MSKAVSRANEYVQRVIFSRGGGAEDVHFMASERDRCPPGFMEATTEPWTPTKIRRVDRTQQFVMSVNRLGDRLKAWIDQNKHTGTVYDHQFDWWYIHMSQTQQPSSSSQEPSSSSSQTEQQKQWEQSSYIQLTRDARVIAQTLLSFVDNRRKSKRWSGFLTTQNVALRWCKKHRDPIWKSNLKLSITEEPPKQNDNYATDGTAILGIFTELFLLGDPDPIPECPTYLREFVELFSDFEVNYIRIRDNSCLWSSWSRTYYFVKVWADYKNDVNGARDKVDKAMLNVRVPENWRSRIVAGTPFEAIYKRKSTKKTGEDKYEGARTDVIHFMRVCIVHVNDFDPKTSRYIYVDPLPEQEVFLNQTFVDTELTRMYPYILYDLTWELQKLDYYR